MLGTATLHSRRATLLVAAIASASLLALAAPSADALMLAPPAGHSPNAGQIHSIYILALVFGVVIFVGVQVALGYVLWRYRAQRSTEPAQLHGNSRLEIGWTLGAVAILVILATFTFVKLSSIVNPQNSGAEGEALLGSNAVYATAERNLPPSGRRLEINVVGRQYVWQFVYPGGAGPAKFGAPYSYEKLVVPTGTTIVLDIDTVDVVHSWWVPELGGKIQAVPGYHNYTWFKVDKPGVFHGQCASLCGRDHARMIATVEAVKPPEFEAWLAGKRGELAEAGIAAAKQRAELAAGGSLEAGAQSPGTAR